MNCLECQDLLQRRLDGECRPASAAMDQHLSQCSTCCDQQALSMRLQEGLKQLPKPELPANFAQTMTADVLDDRRTRQQKMRRRVLVTMALAASVLLMLLAPYFWIRREEPHQAKNPVKKAAPIAIETKVVEPRHALTALTERMADATRDHAKVVFVATNLDGMEKLPVTDLPVIDPGIREAGQEVSDGVRAVTRNARKAFDFFARELPMPELAEQKN